MIWCIAPILTACVAALLMCHTPESVGLLPDAKQPAGASYAGADGERSDAEGDDRKGLLGGDDDSDEESDKESVSTRTHETRSPDRYVISRDVSEKLRVLAATGDATDAARHSCT